MAYGDFKDLTRRIAFSKVIFDKAFNIAKNLKYDDYQRDLASMVYKFYVKKSSGGAVAETDKSVIKRGSKSNQQLAEKLHKPVNKKCEKRKVQLSFKGSIWGIDLADIQRLSKYNKEFRFL